MATGTGAVAYASLPKGRMTHPEAPNALGALIASALLTVVSPCGVLLLSLVVAVLRRCNFLHANFCVILSNVLAALLLNGTAQLLAKLCGTVLGCPKSSVQGSFAEATQTAPHAN